LLEVLGKRIFHTGPVASGVATKLRNNMISITTDALVAEAMVMDVKTGVDADRFYEVLSASSARSNMLERVVPNHFLTRDFEASVSLTTIMKDPHCVIETGRKSGVRRLLPNLAMQCFVDAAGPSCSGLSPRVCSWAWRVALKVTIRPTRGYRTVGLRLLQFLGVAPKARSNSKVIARQQHSWQSEGGVQPAFSS
jgi:hypothetical protein